MFNPYKNLPVRPKYLLLGAVIFSVLKLLESYTEYLINQFRFEYSWYSVSMQALIGNLTWVVLAPVMAQQAQSLISGTGSKTVKVIKAVVVSIFVALIHRFMFLRGFDYAYYLNSGFLADAFSEKNMTQLGAGWITSLIQYWIVLMLFFAIIYYQRYLQKQKELNQAQLQALKMQLHPHFLFNTLHSITSLIDISPKSAQRMVLQLGKLMRNTLERDEKDCASLQEEISYIKSYLDIEHVRFQDRLEITYTIDESVENATIPYMILQPLVENAIKHGVQDMQQDAEIKVEASLRPDGRVMITIADNGKGKSTSKIGKGIGLKNVTKRLRQFYEGDFNFEFGAINARGFQVKIDVPYIEFKEV